MELVYVDDRIVVCVKPAGVTSVDEPGGVPELVRRELGDENATVLTVHRLDQAVSGLMVLARTRRAAGDLSGQIREGTFGKEYLAVVQGKPEKPEGQLRDLLIRDRQRRMTLVTTQPGKDAQEAVLDYRVLGGNDDMSKVLVRLHTGRTHQIRVQFSSRDLPLVGDRKYGHAQGEYPIALWSYRLRFRHPRSGEALFFEKDPPRVYPWTAL